MPNIIEITNFNAPELDIYTRLKENQLQHCFEPAPGLFIAESPNVIERALNSGCKPHSILVEECQIEKEATGIITRCGDIPVYTAPFDVLTKLTGFQLTRGLLCAMYRPALPSVEEICHNASRIAVLENVMNPTNVGAIFRSAAALGMDAVLLTSGCSNPLYRRAVRVSMGTVFQIPWARLDRDWPRQLRDLGIKTAALAPTDRSVSVDDPRLAAEERLALVLGSEGDGHAPAVIEACDYTVKIPMSHGIDSLNVAAAAAVAFWELRLK